MKKKKRSPKELDVLLFCRMLWKIQSLAAIDFPLHFRFNSSLSIISLINTNHDLPFSLAFYGHLFILIVSLFLFNLRVCMFSIFICCFFCFPLYRSMFNVWCCCFEIFGFYQNLMVQVGGFVAKRGASVLKRRKSRNRMERNQGGSGAVTAGASTTTSGAAGQQEQPTPNTPNTVESQLSKSESDGDVVFYTEEPRAGEILFLRSFSHLHASQNWWILKLLESGFWLNYVFNRIKA